MAKKGGSMYYGDLIKGAGTVGESTVPKGVDAWTKAMEGVGDAIIQAAEKQRLEEKKQAEKRAQVEANYTASINDKHGMGKVFYDATEVVVASNRVDYANTLTAEKVDQQAVSTHNMHINSINNENKEVNEMFITHENDEKNDDRSPNMSNEAKALITRMRDPKAGELRLHLNTEEDEGRYGPTGTYTYVWTIDGKEYTKKDYVASILYNNASETDWKELLETYVTRGKDLRDGDKYENEAAFLSEIEQAIRYDVLKQNNPSQKTDALNHWLGNEQFKTYLRNHADLKNLTLNSITNITNEGGLPAGEEDGNGAWDTVLSKGDIEMIIEAATNYDSDYFDEETSLELAIDYMKRETYNAYVEQGNNVIKNYNANQENTLVKGKFTTEAVINEQENLKAFKGYQTTRQFDDDGSERDITRSQKIQFDLDISDKTVGKAFQSPMGHWLVLNDDGKTYSRYSSEREMNKWLAWKSADPNTRGDEPTDQYDAPIFRGVYNEQRLRLINIGSEKTASGKKAKYNL